MASKTFYLSKNIGARKNSDLLCSHGGEHMSLSVTAVPYVFKPHDQWMPVMDSTKFLSASFYILFLYKLI